MSGAVATLSAMDPVRSPTSGSPSAGGGAAVVAPTTGAPTIGAPTSSAATVDAHSPAAQVPSAALDGGAAVTAELHRIVQTPHASLKAQLVDYLEARIAESEAALQSPPLPPPGIDAAHLSQISVCTSRLSAVKVPDISIRAYVDRLDAHCPLSNAHLLAVGHYLMALEVMHRRICRLVRRATAHRLVLTCVVLASKVLDDRQVAQVRWSVVGGISLASLHGLELAVLFLLNGRCWLTEAALVNAAQVLHGRRASTIGVEVVTETDDSVIWSSTVR